jgi:hypothetical protein
VGRQLEGLQRLPLRLGQQFQQRIPQSVAAVLRLLEPFLRFRQIHRQPVIGHIRKPPPLLFQAAQQFALYS